MLAGVPSDAEVARKGTGGARLLPEVGGLLEHPVALLVTPADFLPAVVAQDSAEVGLLLEEIALPAAEMVLPPAIARCCGAMAAPASDSTATGYTHSVFLFPE